MFLSNLEIANLVKGTDLDYVIEVKNEVRYMNLNITEKQKKTIVNDLKKVKKYRNKYTLQTNEAYNQKKVCLSNLAMG